VKLTPERRKHIEFWLAVIRTIGNIIAVSLIIERLG
jgi:hypothetical protein